MRMAEGRVPRQRLATGCGPARMERRTGSREEERDCWTRVLSRSAGWRRMEVVRPDASPATKWKVGWAFLVLRVAS